MSTTQTRETIRDTYAAGGAEYDQVRLTDPRGALLSRHDIDLVLKMWPDPPKDSRLFEVGAGTGRFTTYLLDMGYHIVATDINETMLDELRGKVKDRDAGDRCQIQNEDVFNLSFDSESFDFAYSFHVIPRFLSLADQRSALLEIGRTIRPGGTLFFNYRNSKSPYNWVYKGHSASPKEMRGILAEAGFTITHQQGKMFSTRMLYNRMPMFMNRMFSCIDRRLHRFWTGRAWDVFVIAKKNGEPKPVSDSSGG